MLSVETFASTSSIGVILIHNENIFTGSYDYDSSRTGTVQLYTSSMSLIHTEYTTGTLDLKIYLNYLYACTSSSIIKYNLDLSKVMEIDTDHMNTFLVIYNSLLYVCTSKGSINVYSESLDLLYSLSVSDDILWTCVIYENMIICGGECCNLFLIKNKEIIKSIKFDKGITYLFVDRNLVLMGSYDEHIYKIKDMEILEKNYIGGGIWRILKRNQKFYISCMYEGIKITDEDFKLQSELFKNTNEIQNKNHLIYAIDTNENFLITALFYGYKIFKINL